MTSLLQATDHLPAGTGAYNVTVPYCPALHRRGGKERLKCIIYCVIYCVIHVERHVTRHIYLRWDRTGAQCTHHAMIFYQYCSPQHDEETDIRTDGQGRRRQRPASETTTSDDDDETQPSKKQPAEGAANEKSTA